MRVGILEGEILKISFHEDRVPRTIVATVVIPPVGVIKEVTMTDDGRKWTDRIKFNLFWRKAERMGFENLIGKAVLVEYYQSLGNYESRIVWP